MKKQGNFWAKLFGIKKLDNEGCCCCGCDSGVEKPAEKPMKKVVKKTKK